MSEAMVRLGIYVITFQHNGPKWHNMLYNFIIIGEAKRL